MEDTFFDMIFPDQWQMCMVDIRYIFDELRYYRNIIRYFTLQTSENSNCGFMDDVHYYNYIMCILVETS